MPAFNSVQVEPRDKWKLESGDSGGNKLALTVGSDLPCAQEKICLNLRLRNRAYVGMSSLSNHWMPMRLITAIQKMDAAVTPKTNQIARCFIRLSRPAAPSILVVIKTWRLLVPVVPCPAELISTLVQSVHVCLIEPTLGDDYEI